MSEARLPCSLDRPRRVSFYAPMKPPDYPSPSGDRAMARLLQKALKSVGYDVSLVSSLRTYLRDPWDTSAYDLLLREAEAERGRIAALWTIHGAPDLWVSYHPYYKSPDLLGPQLCRQFCVPWVTVEASLSKRRSIKHWSQFQGYVLDAVRRSDVNIAITARDQIGLQEFDPSFRVERLNPFLEADTLLETHHNPIERNLVTVAMMRDGDKFESYSILAKALEHLRDLNWHLTIAGDGPARERVESLFSGFDAQRITWAGECDPSGIRQVLSRGAIFVWPGYGEAYGLAYLEAQAVGVPIVAQCVAGVPEVVEHAQTGLLTPKDDTAQYAAAIRRLISDPDLQKKLGANGREKVALRHTLERAAIDLMTLLNRNVWSSLT